MNPGKDASDASSALEMVSPLQWRAGHVPGLTGPPGSTCKTTPASLQWRGRARARPDPSAAGPPMRSAKRLQWRAGHVPGLTGGLASLGVVGVVHLQWRAGHVPGLTRGEPGPSNFGTRPSMEGRARARPDTQRPSRPSLRPRPFNGGPGTCPA